jgi:AcrR family transcriptional regulator
MARTVNPLEFTAKRTKILEAANRLVFSKGYEEMSIQDVLNELQISSGAFHHYFQSKEALLDGLVDRIRTGSEPQLFEVVHDPDLNAIQKLQGFLDTLDRLRRARSREIVGLLRVWYTDANAVVRQRVDAAVLEHRTPLLAAVVRQGVREGRFASEYPDLAAQIVLSLLHAMGNAHARLLLSLGRRPDDKSLVGQIVSTYAAHIDAVERVLGARSGCLRRRGARETAVWVRALQEEK